MLMKFMKKIILRSMLISLIGVGLFSIVKAANLSGYAPLTIRRIVIFGDSLSDNGNLYSLTVQLHKINHAIPIIPSPTLYWNGRFSDGPVWNEYLASMLNFKENQLAPEQHDNEQYQNYAYSGSWAEPTQPEANGKSHQFPPPLSAQIDKYMMLEKARHPSDYQEVITHDLIFIWTGGNDYLNQEFNKSPKIRSPEISTDNVVHYISTSLKKLILAGNKNFVVVGLPDLSKIPDIELRDPMHQSLSPNIALASQLHNKKLEQLVRDFQQKYPQVNISYMNVHQLFLNQFQLAQARQQQYARQHQGQFQKTFAPCIIEANDPDPQTFRQLPSTALVSSAQSTKPVATLYKYSQCDLHTVGDDHSPFDYAQHYQAGGIFFDHIHPTTHIHASIALNLCQLLERKGYVYWQKNKNQYRHINCSQDDVEKLTHRIVNPPFPVN